jgi:hypothetical protein
MPNRYSRDELIVKALDMAQLPNLKVHDAPNGVVQADAHSVQWLQDILDFWYHMVPFSAAVTTVQLNVTANQSFVVLPSDFILDVRNGYLVQTVVNDVASYSRAIRLPVQKLISYQILYQHQPGQEIKYPRYYCVQGVDNTGRQLMQLTPIPTISTLAVLWYYQLPPLLESNSKPRFPNDYVCIEYVRIRAREWAGVYEPGTAQRFCDKIVAGMKSAGLMNEPEDDEIPFDSQVYRAGGSRYNSYSWMGAR